MKVYRKGFVVKGRRKVVAQSILFLATSGSTLPLYGTARHGSASHISVQEDPTYQPINLSTYQPINLSTYQPINLFTTIFTVHGVRRNSYSLYTGSVGLLQLTQVSNQAINLYRACNSPIITISRASRVKLCFSVVPESTFLDLVRYLSVSSRSDRPSGQSANQIRSRIYPG